MLTSSDRGSAPDVSWPRNVLWWQSDATDRSDYTPQLLRSRRECNYRPFERQFRFHQIGALGCNRKFRSLSLVVKETSRPEVIDVVVVHVVLA